MDVGKRITELRKIRGISGNKLAQLSGISQSGINVIELGQKFPTTTTLEAICNALGVSLSAFFAEDTGDLSPELRQLVDAVDGLSPAQLEALKVIIDAIKEGR